jgi:hypothetical protein
MNTRLGSLLLLGCVTLAGPLSCASAGASRGAGDDRVITREELQNTGLQSGTALQAVQRLRPRWLDPHPVHGLSRLHVVVDDVRAGGVESLRGLNSQVINSMRFMSATEARTIPALASVPAVDAAIIITSEMKADR